MSAFRYKASYDNPAYVSDGAGLSNKPGSIRARSDDNKCCCCTKGTCWILCGCLFFIIVYGLAVGGVLFYYYYWLPNQSSASPVIAKSDSINGSLKIVGGPYSEFNDDLLNHNSDLFRVYSQGFTAVMNDELKDVNDDFMAKYNTTVVNEFSSGSVITKFTMRFSEKVDIRANSIERLTNELKNHLDKDQYLGATLKIDPDSIHLDPISADSDGALTTPQPTLAPGGCHEIPVQSPINCSKYWSHTSYPNLLGQDQLDAISENLLKLAYALVSNCDDNLEMYICAVHFPKCDPKTNITIQPCQNLTSAMNVNCRFMYQWAGKAEALLNASKVPAFNSSDPDACLVGDGAEDSASKGCKPGEVVCDSGCISKSWLCDGFQDCADNSDESDCASCPAGHRRCGNSARCVADEKLCDGVDDCYGATDERDCFNSTSDGLYITKSNDPEGIVCKGNFTDDVKDHICSELGYNSTDSTFTSVKSSQTPTYSLNVFNNSEDLLLQVTMSNEACPNGDVIKMTCGDVVCGTRPLYVKSLMRVVGGTEAKPGHWPFSVALYTGGKKAYFCGGTLIDKQWVLTAAHCVTNAADYSQMTLEFGAPRRSTYSAYKQERKAVFWQRFPKYKLADFNNDIGIIKLDSPVEINDYVRPICLPDKNMNIEPGMTGIAAGYGKTTNDAVEYSNVINQVGIAVVGVGKCVSGFAKVAPGQVYQINEDVICAGGQKGLDTCSGDSGTALMFERRGRWVVGGVVSSGLVCGGDVPALYTRVPNYVAWINSVIKEHT